MLAYRGPLLDMVYRGERGTLGVRWVRQQYEHILQISLDKDFPTLSPPIFTLADLI